MPVLDTLERPLRTLRVSVTDRCNLRCEYCMPEEEYGWLPRENFLSAGELERLVDAFVTLGVERVRITGGEPLLRPELPEMIDRLGRDGRIRDLALTTNGVLLASQAEELRRAGLRRITVSLDTLRADRFERLARRRVHSQVLEGISAAREAHFDSVRLDCVVVRGVNDDELPDLIDFSRRIGAEIRFIEYMDVAGATRWSMEQVVSRREMLESITRACGAAHSLSRAPSATAERFSLSDGTPFGIIASTTEPFCRDCDRSRLSADGMWFRCLYATEGTNLGGPLRDGASDDAIRELIEGAWRRRTDRGAELRRAVADRRTFVPLAQLRAHPHWEMHKKGG